MDNKPKILIYDIENFPHTGRVWEKYDQTVLKFVSYGGMASFAYKWYGEKRIKCHAIIDFKSKTDKEITQILRDLFHEADCVVAHNGKKFDQLKLRTYCLKHNIPPFSPVAEVDTLQEAKRLFKFPSNSLNDLADYLGIGRKVQTGGYQLWEDCIQGIRKAWRLMKKYNIQDVVLLEKIYDKFAPWSMTRPNLSLKTGKRGCNTCGSFNVIKQGFNYTAKGRQQQYQCKDCGKWMTRQANKGLKDYGK